MTDYKCKHCNDTGVFVAQNVVHEAFYGYCFNCFLGEAAKQLEIIEDIPDEFFENLTDIEDLKCLVKNKLAPLDQRQWVPIQPIAKEIM